MVTLLLRDKEYSVRAGSTLLVALEKAQILPESVIATREGEMILEDEILHDGEVIRLVAVISGGSGGGSSAGFPNTDLPVSPSRNARH